MSNTGLTNALTGYKNATDNSAKNASNKEVSGFDQVNALFVQSGGKSMRNGQISASSPSVIYQKTRDIKAEAEVTGRTGDLAIDGPGHVVIKTLQGTTALSSMMSFRIDGVDKKITGPSGEILMGWKLDENGEIPSSSTSIDSVEEISVKGLNSLAEASSRVTVLARLSEDQKLLDGPGDIINLSRFNAAKSDGISTIITPGENNDASLRLGDTLELGPVGRDVSHKFQFGGISMTRKVDASNLLFGAASATDAFSIVEQGDVPGNNQLKVNQTLQITVGGSGTTYTFRVSKASDGAAKGEFNSLQTLAKAITDFTKGEVRAHVGGDNRLYVAAKDADAALTFSEGSNGLGGPRNLVQELGLTNVLSNPNNSGYKRYASLKELRTKIEFSEAIRSSLNPSTKEVTFSAERATGALSIAGSTSQPRVFQHVFWGDKDNILKLGDNDTNARNVITITSPGHGLLSGDHIRIKDPGPASLGGFIRDSDVVRVLASSADAFVIASIAPSTALGIAPEALGTQFADHGAEVNTTWQRVEGVYNDDNDTPPTSTNQSDVGALGAGYCPVTIQINGGFAADSRINFIVNDMVYITGSTVVEDGIYRISAVNVGANTIEIQAKDGANTDLKVAANFGLVADPNAEIRLAARAGQNVGAVANSTGIDTFPLRITGAAGTANEKTIRISTDSLNGVHSYKEGDVLFFRNLEGEEIKVAGTTYISQNKAYDIKRADPNGKWIEIEADTANAEANELRFGMYRNEGIGGAGNMANAAFDANNATALGRGFTIEVVSKAFKGLGISANVGYFATHAATYEPVNRLKNMSSGRVKPQHEHVVDVYDSLGEKHQVRIGYIRITNTEWAVEVYVPEQEDGTYDIKGTQNRRASDNITFNGDGTLKSIGPGLQGKISFEWKNGANPSEIELDFGDVTGLIDNPKGNLTLSAGEYDVEDIHPNGNAAGNLDGIEYLEDGSILARFSNGASRVFAKLPVAMVADPNSLIAIGNGHFVANEQKSGIVILKQAGQGGAGTFNPGFLTGSGVDSIAEIMQMNTLAQTQQVIQKAMGINNKVMDSALREL